MSELTQQAQQRIILAIGEEIHAQTKQVQAAIDLLDEGATVPFIARYRKEVTGGLDDTQLRQLQERLVYLREMEERRAAVIESIDAQGKLTSDLLKALNEAQTKQRIEDLYLPYKPKRRTRAQMAKEAGLEPLADALLADPTLDPQMLAAQYLNAEKGIVIERDALNGARDILSERFSEDAQLLESLRSFVGKRGLIVSQVVEGQELTGVKFKDYFEYEEALLEVPFHNMF